MNSAPDEHCAHNYICMNFSVGKSGGSAGELFDTRWSRRGLDREHDDENDPLVIWWARLLEKGNSVRRTKLNQCYRRSRWAEPREKPAPSPFSPYSTLHKQGRLINFSLCVLILALGSSLNMVARAETPVGGGAVTQSSANASQTPYSERFSRMKDFVGRHNQYLDLSKLNEFTWAEDSHFTAARHLAKPGADAVFRRQTEEDRVQPQAVNLKESKKSLQSDTRLREEAKNQASGWGDLQSGKWQENAK